MTPIEPAVGEQQTHARQLLADLRAAGPSDFTVIEWATIIAASKAAHLPPARLALMASLHRRLGRPA
jgi:hypothetical protein